MATTAEMEAFARKVKDRHEEEVQRDKLLCLQCGAATGLHYSNCPVVAGEPGKFSMPNPSGLFPLGLAVLVKPYEPEINKSLLVMPETVKERTSAVETRAIVIAIGPEAWRDESQPRARLGDKVLISRFAGVMAIGVKDGERYRIVNDRDIFCRIEE